MSKKHRRLLRSVSIINECIRVTRHAAEAQEKYFEFMKLSDDQGKIVEEIRHYTDANSRSYILK